MNVEFAWRVHAALESWTTRADVKASILLAVEGGAAVFVVGSPDDHRSWPAAVILILLLAAMATTASVVLPILGPRRMHRAEFARHSVYFGHLRHWRPAELTAHLDTLTPADELAMLASQLVRMSRLNWRKHRLLQVSVLLLTGAVAGMALTLF
ncbi:Pycsar system effector family protein [Dactylosporangium sp. CS-047395]|uniref:Pycsar system effector family protein n=1 Tax=Dactylosporangium sp. CS-047395 TaxID=3239936 RepID=UPI003D920365